MSKWTFLHTSKHVKLNNFPIKSSANSSIVMNSIKGLGGNELGIKLLNWT